MVPSDERRPATGLPCATRRTTLGACAAATMAALAGCTFGSEETDESTRTVDVTTGTLLAVRTRNGDVAVHSGDDDGVELTVTKRTRGDPDLFDRVAVVERRTDDGVTLETEYDGETARRRVAVDLEVALPSGVPLGRAGTANGDVDVAAVGGDPRLQTSNGEVVARDVDGFVAARSSNGDVTVRGAAGVDDASTANGDVTVEVQALRMGGARLATTNGSVDAELSPALDATLDCRTGNGDVSVTDLELADVSRSGGSLTGRLGGGDDELVVRTGNGDIELSAL